MNQRIKELAEQAGMTDDKFGMFFAKYKHDEDGVDLEKFAELLIKECGQWFNDRLTVEPDYGMEHRIERNRAVVGVMKEYNKHFGVEE